MIYSQINIRKLRVQRFDGDIMFTTNNNIMVNNFENSDVVICVQKTAEKKVLDNPNETERILLESNKLGFGDEIGQITNRITSMFDILCNFKPGTREYETIMYRIIASQMYAQMAIDKVKGIITNGMPRHWYKYITEPQTEEDEFNNRICVDKKPYFMKYIYPDIDKEYKEVLKVSGQGLRRTSDSEERKEYYDNKVPVNDNTCVMNRLCHMVEDEFKSYKHFLTQKEFDHSILKSNNGYSKDKYNKIYALYKKYVAQKRIAQMVSNDRRRSVEEYTNELELIKSSFVKECYEVCSSSDELCNIVVDICYSIKNSKAFAWEMCGDQIIKNLLDRNNNQIKYITKDDNGDIEYDGYKFAARYITDNTF